MEVVESANNNAQPKPSDPDQLMLIDQVAELVGVSQRAIYNWIRLRPPQFPQPIRIGRVVRWRRRTITAWMDRKEGKR